VKLILGGDCVLKNINNWIPAPKSYKHKIGFNYEVYENTKIPSGKLDSLYDFLAQNLLRNYVSPKVWKSIKKNPTIKDKSKYISDKYIPSKTGNFNLRTGEFGEVVSKLIFENKYEFIIYRFHYKENKDEPVKIYDLVGFLMDRDRILEVVLFEVKAQSSKLDEEIVVKATNQISKNVVARLLKYLHFIERVLSENEEFDLYKMINDYHLNDVEKGKFSHKLKVTLVCEKSIYDEIVLDNLDSIKNTIDTKTYEVAVVLLDDMKTLRDVSYLRSSECYEDVFGT
jgi:hypothetical protein